MEDVKDLIRKAMGALSEVHRASAGELGIPVANGYPKWNDDNNVVQGKVQEFNFRVGDRQASLERIGTEELLQYAKGDRTARARLDALMKHLCGQPEGT